MLQMQACDIKEKVAVSIARNQNKHAAHSVGEHANDHEPHGEDAGALGVPGLDELQERTTSAGTASPDTAAPFSASSDAPSAVNSVAMASAPRPFGGRPPATLRPPPSAALRQPSGNLPANAAHLNSQAQI